VVVLALKSARLRVDFAIVAALALWLIVPFSGLAVIWNHFDHVGLVALVVLCKIGDTAAYYVGNAIGKHHPFKTISPGKTIEGCAASFVAGCACGAGLVAAGILPRAPHGWIAGCAAGAIVNLAAQAGDLLESWVKRRAGVKDSGTWFGPSGGMLDLVDSVLLGLPAALATWPLLFTWQ
jgi:phosphatidate cytidylyltransferase